MAYYVDMGSRYWIRTKILHRYSLRAKICFLDTLTIIVQCIYYDMLKYNNMYKKTNLLEWVTCVFNKHYVILNTLIFPCPGPLPLLTRRYIIVFVFIKTILNKYILYYIGNVSFYKP